ncbi:unnamed protein product [Protopolystoma xenopodis]|uniref:Uncharacterized protein n=1 Tax=Protopolystoma xenopodis TaxID=117903 RepID=A0A448X6C2_9PLAT|nr:unnamed protein product [Protopolystoma xenopodis]
MVGICGTRASAEHKCTHSLRITRPRLAMALKRNNSFERSHFKTALKYKLGMEWPDFGIYRRNINNFADASVASTDWLDVV